MFHIVYRYCSTTWLTRYTATSRWRREIPTYHVTSVYRPITAIYTLLPINGFVLIIESNYFVHFSIKIWHLVASDLLIFFWESIDHSVSRIRLNLGPSHNLGPAKFEGSEPRFAGVCVPLPRHQRVTVSGPKLTCTVQQTNDKWCLRTSVISCILNADSGR